MALALRRQDDVVDSLGGYRLVRRLGAGSRSEVWLGSDGSETAAIKVFRTGIARESIDAEIEALGRASGRHIVRLEDLAMGPDGLPCLILQRLSQWNLGRVLGTFRPSDGEAVTILAPLCLAVAELHRLGVAHGRVRGSSVLFDFTGAPMIASFGDATVFGDLRETHNGFSVPPAQLLNQPAVAADLAGLEGLCRSTLRPDSDVLHWLAWTECRNDSTFAQELAERLFRFAAAAPVRFATPAQSEIGALVPSRTTMPLRSDGEARMNDSDVDEPASHSVTRFGAAMSDAAAFLHLPEGIRKPLAEWLEKSADTGPLALMVQRVKEVLKPVRKPVWIIAGLVAASVVVAAAILPPSGQSQAELGSSDEKELMPHSATAEPVVQTSAPAITADDPIAAASALLDARTVCFEARSVLCLDSVNQQGSAAMRADAAHVRLLQQGGAVDGSRFVDPKLAVSADGEIPDPERVVRHIAVQEQLGASALLSITFGEPDAEGPVFTLLLIKQEEGWRIRDLTPVTDSPYPFSTY